MSVLNHLTHSLRSIRGRRRGGSDEPPVLSRPAAESVTFDLLGCALLCSAVVVGSAAHGRHFSAPSLKSVLVAATFAVVLPLVIDGRRIFGRYTLATIPSDAAPPRHGSGPSLVPVVLGVALFFAMAFFDSAAAKLPTLAVICGPALAHTAVTLRFRHLEKKMRTSLYVDDARSRSIYTASDVLAHTVARAG